MISIIVPVYQCKEDLENIIVDILNQTYQDYELLLIDDGSTDGTAKLCQEYEKKYAKIKAVLKAHEGVSAARNEGILNAKGDLIAFIDADDRIEADYLEKLYEGIADSDLVIASFDRWFYKKGKCVNIVKNDLIDAQIKLDENFEDYFSKLYMTTLIGVVYCKLFRKKIIEENNISFRKDIYLGEDYLFNFEYIKGCKQICCVPYRGYHYIVSDELPTVPILHNHMR